MLEHHGDSIQDWMVGNMSEHRVTPFDTTDLGL